MTRSGRIRLRRRCSNVRPIPEQPSTSRACAHLSHEQRHPELAILSRVAARSDRRTESRPYIGLGVGPNFQETNRFRGGGADSNTSYETGFFVFQQVVNSDLRMTLDSAAWAGFVSYLGGTLCMLIVALALREDVPSVAAIARSNW
jgi:hypothetical protein